MGLFADVLRSLLSDSAPEQRRRQPHELAGNYTVEEYVIHEQGQSGERWHGVPLSELSKLAQTVYHGKYVKVDQYGFLLFCFTSNSNKTNFRVQCDLDERGQLMRLSRNYYPGQWKDLADDFIAKANQAFTFQ